MSTPGSNNKTATWRDLILLSALGTSIFAGTTALVGRRPALIITSAYSVAAFKLLAARLDAREKASEAASRKTQPREEEGPREAPFVPFPTPEELIEDAFQGQLETLGESWEPVEDLPEYAPEQDGEDGPAQEEEEVSRQAAVATQTISPALYGTGVIDEVSGQIGQVNLLETGLNVLAKVNVSGTINEVNEGMEVVTGVPRDDLLGTDAFSYFIEPDVVKGWFMEALHGLSVRDKEVEVMHQEGETTPLTYNVIATSSSNGQTGGVLLCRYRED